jgi:ABC-type lipopolysaccharide export system ATPase subunit
LLVLLQKIFLNTTRLLSEHTNNLVEEVWNYIKDGKLLQTAVLLLAAQAHIRVIDGFSTIITRIAEESTTIKFEISQDEKEKLDLEAKCQHLLSALLLVQIIDKAGNALDSCIQRRKEVAYLL